MFFQETWKTKFQVRSGCWVHVPTEATRNNGETIRARLSKIWQAPPYYFHLRSGGHVKALQKHAHNQFFLHLDIKKFFECINKSRVTRNLKPFFGYKEARLIAVESTVRHPEDSRRRYILPFGFVQSPIIASVCLYNSKLGGYLDSLEKGGTCISIYMDDIIISSDDEIELQDILKEIERKSDLSYFPLNSEKTEGPRKKITSFNVELSYLHLEINHSRIQKFQSAYLRGNCFQQKGILSYIKSINSRQASKFQKACQIVP